MKKKEIRMRYALTTVTTLLLLFCPPLLAASEADTSASLPTPAQTNPPRPQSVGPFVLSSADGASSLKIGFAGQLLYHFDRRDIGDEDGDATHDFGIRRLRLSLAGTAFSKRFGFNLQLSPHYSDLALMDLFLNYRLFDHLQIRVGQHKVPFTRYRLGSFKTLTLVDWSPLAGYFGAERQRGATLHNGLKKMPRFAYAFGLYTGQNARTSNGEGIAKIYGESRGNPSALADPAPQSRVHPELVAHLSYNHGGIDTSTDTDRRGGPPRFSLGISGAYDIRPDPFVDFSHRIAPEVLLKAYGLSFSSVFYAGFSPEPGAAADIQKSVLGLLVQSSYCFLERYEVSARWSFIDVDRDAIAGAIERDEENAGTLTRLNEITVGFNLYLIGTSLRWQNDVSWGQSELVEGTRDDLQARSQLTLGF